MKSINCKGKLIDLSIPKVMGILNLTPDSFYDGGEYDSEKKILLQTEKMLLEGATFIDIGAYSSRPGAKNINEQEELSRLKPNLELIVREFPDAIISIDTFRSNIAIQCIDIGASIVNDISAGNLDDQMFKTIANLQVPFIAMHMQGTPQNMSEETNYDKLINDIAFYFSKKINQLESFGINDIILDIGFGFGKTLDQNYELLRKLNLFSEFERPMLTGISRKSMLYKLLDTSSIESLNATTVGNTIALLNGSNILRVHDVKEAIEAIKIVNKMNSIK